MNVTAVEAEGKLEELLRRAANGEEVAITGPDRSSARLVPVDAPASSEVAMAQEQCLEERMAILREI